MSTGRGRWVKQLGPPFLLAALLIRSLVPTHAQGTALDTSDEIVYLSAGGKILVDDPAQTAANRAVQWTSPDEGWRAIALGDFNADGDDEIAAVGGEAGSARLTVFDPVVAEGPIDPDRRINYIPWDILYSTALTGKPSLLVAGDFDLDRAGAELLVGEELTDPERPNDRFLLTLWRTNGAPDGRSWVPMAAPRAFDHLWSAAAAGNVDGAGADEVALVSEDAGILSVYRVDYNFDDALDRIFNQESDSRRWIDAAFGPFRSAGTQLAAVRGAGPGFASFFVFRYDNGRLRDDYSEVFVPFPTAVFGAGLAGSGRQQVLMLRQVPTNITNRPRLFMRNLSGEALPAFETALDGDDSFRVGAGGDTDGDGRDEVVVMSATRLRIYTSPESNTSSTDLNRGTDAAGLAIGDLDRAGYVLPPTLAVRPTELTLAVPQGRRAVADPISLFNTGDDTAILFDVEVEGRPAWIEVSYNRNQTPALLTANVDATHLLPGDYRTSIVARSSDPQVANSPLSIPVLLHVETSLVTEPKQIVFDWQPCTAGLPVQEGEVRVEGLPGQAFTAALSGAGSAAPVWVTAAPLTGTVPATLTLTADPALRTADMLTATLVLTESNGLWEPLQRDVPIYLVCANDRSHMPVTWR